MRLRTSVGRLWVTVGVVALTLAGCGQNARQAEVPAAPTVASPRPAPATPTPTVVPIPAGQFQNPVLQENFPDPHIIRVDGIFYAFATNSDGCNVCTARSTNLVDWELTADAMPELATWVNKEEPHVWAPEVLEIDERYVLYYTARDKESNRQCIGVAISDEPQGRYRDENGHPFICQAEQGGSIDASPFRDEDGTLYLYWKNDGNCCGMATYLFVQHLAADGLSLVEEPVQLIRNDAVWEGPVIEAPTMWRQDGRYYLFYSANVFSSINYAVGYATCESATGPCEKLADNPILQTSRERPPVIGPGHQTIVVDDAGQTWLVYHAWEVGEEGMTERRFMWLDQLVWEDGKPKVLGPTTDPQPAPEISEPVTDE